MDYREKVKKIIEIFGMRYKVAAKAMGITYDTMRQKMNKQQPRNTVNQKDYHNLVDYVKTNAKKIKKEDK